MRKREKQARRTGEAQVAGKSALWICGIIFNNDLINNKFSKNQTQVNLLQMNSLRLRQIKSLVLA